MTERLRRRVTLGFAAAVLATTAACDRGSHPKNLGRPAPEFVVSDGTRTVDLEKLRGHVVVLNLWASWCTPCVAEVPSLMALQQQMPDVVVVGISMDEDEASYRRFLDRYHVNFVTVRDPTAKVNALYGTAQIPETYVIDQQGVLRRKFVSDQNWTSPEIVGYLKKLDS